ncbi:MAG: PDZ domain-containing protein [Pirellulales bacterium]|nr:PDZ domain-containing protein [Pirellulales bacterium]
MQFPRAIFLPVRFAACVICLGLVLETTASADNRRDNGQMIHLVRPIAATVKDSVVQVLIGGRPVALGTVVGADGYLLTKRSELNGDPIRVRLADGRLFPARVAAVRRRNDLALLRIEADAEFTPVKFVGDTPPVASFLISAGRAGRPIGLGVVSAPERAVGHQGRLGVLLEDDSKGRALVQGVYPHSGADIAGLERGDRIVAINGHAEKSRESVVETLRSMFPGESVRLTVLRPNASDKLDTIEMDAGIRDLNVMQETENDSKVNGPRNVRLNGFDRVIQHDTVLDPDECGGPILDSSGQVLGINIARAGRVVSYALPAALVIPEMVGMLEEARAAAN